jgi:hypothetical protein
MVTDALIALVVHVIGTVLNALLPTLNLGGLTFTVAMATAFYKVGQFFHSFNSILPSNFLLSWLLVYGSLLLLRAGYIIFEWILEKLGVLVDVL